jgi:hypothetical protein
VTDISAHCPTSFELGAALRAATVLGSQGTPRAVASASYALIPTGGVYRHEHFLRAELLLQRCKFLEIEEDVLKPAAELLEICRLPESQAMEVLFLAAVERLRPVWVFAACEGTQLAPEAIPDDDWAVFQSIVRDPARREEFLLALGRRFDMQEAAAIGADGEVFVVQRCREELTRLGHSSLADRVRRVSVVSDQLGYDVVAPTVADEPWRIEVKTTRSNATFVRFVITRNEAKVGLSDQRWVLVICVETERGRHEIAGWCHAKSIGDLLPSDRSDRGNWLSARLTLDRSHLHPGLPRFAFEADAI